MRRFRSSGMSVTQFCQTERISTLFFQWRNRLETAKRQPHAQSVRIGTGLSPETSSNCAPALQSPGSHTQSAAGSLAIVPFAASRYSRSGS